MTNFNRGLKSRGSGCVIKEEEEEVAKDEVGGEEILEVDEEVIEEVFRG